jgi:site-specific DNA-methyltransferase (adenine-specific)
MKPYYEDELVTLYHGDALEVQAWQDADVLVTDPPYGIAWTGVGNYINGIRSPKWAAGIANDETANIRDEVIRRWGTRPAIVFGTWKVPRPEGTVHRLIWHKRGMAPGPVKSTFMSQDEEIYVLGSGFLSTSPPMRSVLTTDESRSKEVSKIGHPTPKPVGLMEQLMARCPDGIIADPFAGSGATLIAARNLGRQSIGVELEERYCEIIANRLSQQAFDFSELD